MRAPQSFTRVLNGKRYDVSKATLIASDAYWDGHNFERHGRNTFLYRTPRGAYFQVCLTCWEGEHDSLIPLSIDDALDLYEYNLREHEVEHEVAFPEVLIEEA